MINSITSAGGGTDPIVPQKRPNVLSRDNSAKTDSVSFGGGGKVGTAGAMNIVVERAFEKLRAVVDEARAELGLAPDATLDTSPEATANRIADFALNFFGKYAENHGLADDEAGRQQFVDFIGKAIGQGIEEARGILTSLNAINGEIDSNISTTADVIQQRLNDFVKNGARPSV